MIVLPRRTIFGVALALTAFPASATDRADINRRVFDAVWRRVDREYYDPNFRGVDWAAARATYAPQASAAENEDALYRVLTAMLGLLRDGHARAVTPAQMAERMRRLKQAVASGAGFDVRFAGGRAVVTAVWPQSPADQVGIQAGWLLESINGRPFGPAAPAPALPFSARFVTAGDETRDIEVTVAAYALAPERIARAYLDAAYLKFDRFEDADIDWVETQLARLGDVPLILDLRNNTGGALSQLERLLARFIEGRTSYATVVTRTGRPVTLTVSGRSPQRSRPVVLVDKGSNSSAEVFAGVIQAHGRGVVVGEPTLGNALFAIETRLPDGGALMLSTRDLVLASGRRIEGAGVTPDIIAERTLEDFRSLRDPGLQAALTAAKL